MTRLRFSRNAKISEAPAPVRIGQRQDAPAAIVYHAEAGQIGARAAFGIDRRAESREGGTRIVLAADLDCAAVQEFHDAVDEVGRPKPEIIFGRKRREAQLALIEQFAQARLIAAEVAGLGERGSVVLLPTSKEIEQSGALGKRHDSRIAL